MPPFVVRDAGLLQATLAQPYQQFNDRDLYRSVVAKAGCLFRGLIKNHPLVDGNKRVAVTTTTTFLLLNGYRLTASNNEIRDYALRVARHRGEYSIAAITRWFSKRCELVGDAARQQQRKRNEAIKRSLPPIDRLFTD